MARMREQAGALWGLASSMSTSTGVDLKRPHPSGYGQEAPATTADSVIVATGCHSPLAGFWKKRDPNSGVGGVSGVCHMRRPSSSKAKAPSPSLGGGGPPPRWREATFLNRAFLAGCGCCSTVGTNFPWLAGSCKQAWPSINPAHRTFGFKHQEGGGGPRSSGSSMACACGEHGHRGGSGRSPIGGLFVAIGLPARNTEVFRDLARGR